MVILPRRSRSFKCTFPSTEQLDVIKMTTVPTSALCSMIPSLIKPSLLAQHINQCEVLPERSLLLPAYAVPTKAAAENSLLSDVSAL